MSGIPVVAWVMFAADVVVPVTATAIISRRSRALAEAARAAGRSRTTRTTRAAGGPADSLAPPRAGYATALWLVRFDLVGISGVALVCLIVLRSRPSALVLVESVLFGCCLVSLVLNAMFSRSAAKRAAEEEARENRSTHHGT